MLQEEEGILLGEEAAEVERGHWPPVEWVPVSAIQVDTSYQRDEIPRHVKEIAQSFDLERFGVPELASREDGTYAVIDGQQRIAAVRLYNEDALGPLISEILAKVHHGKTADEQALLYVQMNTKRVRVSALDQWKPRILFGDETATAIGEMLDQYGLEVGKGEDKIGAVAALEDIYTGYQRKTSGANRIKTRRSGPEALDRTLASITVSWDIHEGRFGSDVIAGVGLFFHRFVEDELDYDTLATTMTKMPPEALRAEATAEVNKSHGLESRRSAFAKTLALSYNRQARIDGTRGLPVDERFPGHA